MTQAEAKRMVCGWLSVRLIDLASSGWEDLPEGDEGRVMKATNDLYLEMVRRSKKGWPGADEGMEPHEDGLDD